MNVSDPLERATGQRPLVSVVMPAFNEAGGIQGAIRTVLSTLAPLDCEPEVIVVDDGSDDATYARSAELSDAGLPVRVLRLSRNFGKEGALLAGLEAAQGAAVITIDADQQHPPSLIPAMLAEWRAGAKIVHGVKRNRGDEPWLCTQRARLANALITRLGGIDLRNASDFKLLDREAVELLTRHLPEHGRFFRGLVNWIGFPQVELEFDVAPRTSGVSGWRIGSLLTLTVTALVSFTSAPLRVVSVLGLLTLLLAIGVGGEALRSWLLGHAVSGFATIIITLLMIGSFIMISLGVIGEYIAKIYDEIKGRPAYILERMHGPTSLQCPKRTHSYESTSNLESPTEDS